MSVRNSDFSHLGYDTVKALKSIYKRICTDE
jgi:hypothetical protein